jgi:DNA-binding transcriptional MerR regulator
MSTQLTIGDVSKRTGVPVKTIRYYADEGLVPPTSLTDAGYRLFTESDVRRLTIVRNLRALGFSLEAIRTMLDGSRNPQELATLQLELVQTQIRALERQRAVLRAAQEQREGVDALRYLDAAFAAASLGAAERQHALERWLDRATFTHAGTEGHRRIRGMVLDGLPDELTPEQLEAWVHVNALLEDEGLLETLRLQQQPFADVKHSEERQRALEHETRAVLDEAVAAMRDGAGPGDPRIEQLLDRWMAPFASMLELENDADFPAWFLAFARRTNDARIERFWKYVAVLKGWPGIPPFTKAQALLCDALEHRLASKSDQKPG